MLFDKRDYVAGLAASEAFVNATLGIDVERGSLFFVKRAQSQIIATCMAQLDILTNDVNDVRLDADFIDDMWGDAHEQLQITDYRLLITDYWLSATSFG